MRSTRTASGWIGGMVWAILQLLATGTIHFVPDVWPSAFSAISGRNRWDSGNLV